MTSANVIDQFHAYVIGNYTRYPVCLVRGEGSYVWDAEVIGTWTCSPAGAGPLGPLSAASRRRGARSGRTAHSRPEYLVHGAAGATRTSPIRADRLRRPMLLLQFRGGGDEAAIKLARLNSTTGRYKIITMINSFHGRTMGALRRRSEASRGVEPSCPDFKYAPFGDLAAAAAQVDDATCAIMVEPIQREGGVNLPPLGISRRAA